MSATPSKTDPSLAVMPGSPIFPETFEDLHAARGKRVLTMGHCHGDTIIADLRIARGRLERSLKTLKECIATARRNEKRYDIGSYIEDLLDELEDGGIDFMYWGWFSRRAQNLMDCVLDAEGEDGEDEDLWPIPEEPTWKDFRAFSAALREHGEALKQLQSAESLAAPRPVNSELSQPELGQ